MKSSDNINADIEYIESYRHQNPNCDIAYNLVLKKWANLHPAMEFRCFIYHHCLIGMTIVDYQPLQLTSSMSFFVGICQRYCDAVYEFLIEDKDEIEILITQFYKKKVETIFPLENCKLNRKV